MVPPSSLVPKESSARTRLHYAVDDMKILHYLVTQTPGIMLA